MKFTTESAAEKASHVAGHVRRYLSNPYLWVGLAGLLLVLGIIYGVFNSLIMPSFTRHSESVSVPSVVSLPSDEAASVLTEAGLQSEQVILRKPNLPRDIVIDQNPPPDAQVKPGRRIYLTVNVGDTTTVLVPNVDSFPIREARSRITVHGLRIKEVLPDSIPSPHANTVTRQFPRAGTSVPAGTEVTLWFGTGLGEKDVIVPDVTGMTVLEAKEALLSLNLRSVVVGQSEGAVGTKKVVEQGTAAGTSVKEGFEIRLRLERQEDSLDDIND
jgi:beta-lactam-binding protein with PASTA domain